MADLSERKYYAHTKEGCPPEEWQLLDEHLKNVAETARSFADSFGAGEQVRILNTKQKWG